MTFRERIVQLLASILTPDEIYISETDDRLNAASELQHLAGQYDQLFGLEGEQDFIAPFNQLYGALEATGSDIHLAFPAAGNIRHFLALANRLDDDQLDRNLPPNLDDLRLHEDAALDRPFSQDGNSLRAFGFESALPQGSIAFLDLTSPLAEGDFSNSNLSQNLTAIACILVGESAGIIAPASHTISSSLEADKRQEYLKYQLLLHGKVLTQSFPSPAYNALADISVTLSAANDYRQFKEPFDILSEVNSRTSILDTYLSSYHVIENYMVRSQIAAIERNVPGALFNVRQFKSLGEAVSDKEPTQFSKLFASCWEKSIGGQRLDAFAESCVANLPANPSFNEVEFYVFVERLGIKPATAPLGNPSEFRKIIPKLLYAVRCAIVHNKETEYHISNRELRTGGIRVTLTDLCIPVMQRLGFGLPSIQGDNPISYSQPFLRLY